MTAFYLAIGGDLDPTKRSYYRESWNEKSWWLPWHYDVDTGQWLMTTAPHAALVTPTPYRTIEKAEAVRASLSSRFVVYIVNATTHRRVEPGVPVARQLIPPNAPVCTESVR